MTHTDSDWALPIPLASFPDSHLHTLAQKCEGGRDERQEEPGK